jgi:hypothetical protein
VSKKPKTLNDLTERHRCILASFVFIPLSKRDEGRQVRDMIRTCLPVFRLLFNARHSENWPMCVSNTLRTLTRLGLVTKTGTIKRSWSDKEGSTKEYDSPIYALTESGFAYVLGTMDETHLCDFWHAYKMYSKRSYTQETVHSFCAFSGIRESKFGWYR